MKAILLAAGLGTRLRPLTDVTPKCLVPIHERPLLQYWLDLLRSDLISQIFINTHYLPHQVEAFIAASPQKGNIEIWHEPVLLGTGGTLLKNRQFLSDGPFLLIHADNLSKFNLNEFILTHSNRKAYVEITMMTFETDAPERCGIVSEDQHGVVQAFYEKSKAFHGTRANAAVYIIEPSVIDFISSLNKEVIDFSTEVLPHYLGRIQTYHNALYHRDIETPESLQMAELEYE